MNRTVLLLGLACAGVVFCSTPKNSGNAGNSSAVVAQIGNEKIYLSDLYNDWKLGVPPEKKASRADLEEFLPMYVDFRLKVMEARNGGYEQDSAISTELRGYELQFAVPYWFQKELENELVDELVTRSASQVKVSHVLLKVPENASYSDTLRAYKRLLEARELFLKKTHTFDQLNEIFSSREGNRTMGGALGWVDAGWSVKPFEDVAFTTPVGEASMPFRTKFGYHILLVEAKRPAVTGKKFSHLFLRVNNHKDTLEMRSVMERATGYYNEIKGGTPWDSVVARYSDDKLSSKNGGVIGWVDYTKGFRPQFIDTVMKMSAINEISKPFYSTYGIHIMKLDSLESLKTPAEKKTHWLNKLKQLDRYSDSRRTVFSKIRKIGKEQADGRVYESFRTALQKSGASVVKTTSIPDSLAKKPVYRLNGSVSSVQDFWKFVQSRYPDEQVLSNADRYFEEFKDFITEREMIVITRQRFKDFEELSNRYRNGLVVYAITEDSVWEYAKSASARLKQLYAVQSDQYWFGVRYQFRRYSVLSDSSLTLLQKRLDSGMPLDSVHKNMKDVNLESGELTSLEDEPFNRLVGLKPGERTSPFEFRKRQNILLLEAVKAPEPMTFEDAEFRLVSDFQRIRESEWLTSLRAKYSVILRPENISL